jgi:hypothetical protein
MHKEVFFKNHLKVPVLGVVNKYYDFFGNKIIITISEN